jgi:hypothetical protein
MTEARKSYRITLIPRAVSCRNPEGNSQQLHEAVLLPKRSRCLNISAFCREVIAEKLERLEQVEAVK